jgi:hypothetical protein
VIDDDEEETVKEDGRNEESGKTKREKHLLQKRKLKKG